MDTPTTELFPVDIEIDRSSPTPLYLQVANGYAGGLTPLLDADGRPLKWAVEERA